MNLKQFANVDSFLRDLDTGQEISWRDYMRRVIDKLGFDNVQSYVPFDINYLKEKYKKDIHFNNTPLRAWDVASGFVPEPDKKTKTLEYKRIRIGIAQLFVYNDIRTYSPSDCVCVLKEAARIMCEQELKDEKERNY